MFVAHWPHVPRFVLQMGDAVGQSLFDTHCTHSLSVVLQIGAEAPHCELLVQPARHLNSCGSQIGCALPQSRLFNHCTHW